MDSFEYKGHTAIDYAKEACNTLMKKFKAEELPPIDRFHYHQGVFLSGMEKTYQLTKDKEYYNYIKAYVDYYFNDDGTINLYDEGMLDDLQPGILLFNLYKETEEDRYKDALTKIVDLIKNFPTNEEGGFWHKWNCENQMWLDGLYMGGPVCAEYGATFDEEEFFDICAHQALLTIKRTKDPDTGLLYHVWDSSKVKPWADKETGLSSEFWGRAIGWVPVAILDELDHFPDDHKDRQELIKETVDLIKVVCKYQDQDTGLWYQVIDKGHMEDNWVESSCTSLFVAAICKAVRKGYLEEDYLEYAEKGYKGIIDRLRYDENGVIIDNVCVGTGVGDYKHYINRPTRENDLHGVGTYLLMVTEIAKTL